MNVAVIDADLISNRNKTFPNLCCMKISAYHKSIGDNVTLKQYYGGLKYFDKVYISKVFEESQVPEHILTLSYVVYGGTGFYFDKAPPLPTDIEHISPDYTLYDEYVRKKRKGLKPRSKVCKYFIDYAIGHTTRFCFRKCSYCVNRNADHVQAWTSVQDLVAQGRKKICLLDDNFLGFHGHEKILEQLQETGKRYQFKQGLDMKLLTPTNADLLANANYDGDYIFSFDDIADERIMREKMQLWHKKTGHKTARGTMIYLLCAYDRHKRYDAEFWANDIKGLFERIKILFEFGFMPYVMRYHKYKESPFHGTYVNIASWCNQPQFVKTLSYEAYCHAEDKRCNTVTATIKSMNALEMENPEIARQYYGIKYKKG